MALMEKLYRQTHTDVNVALILFFNRYTLV